VACGDAPLRTGEATYYDFADGSGACTFEARTDSPLLVAAMNAPDWAGSEVCGTCAEITGPSGSVTVEIVDQCPECASGDLDLSPEAFDFIAERALGRVAITWREVPCDVTGNVVWHVGEGSNPYWGAFQVRNHRHRIVSLEIRGADGAWESLPRADYNRFIDETMPGDSFALRATDVHGNVVTDEGIPIAPEATDHAGSAQLPPCAAP
jgi:expansin (peptidoglycan-binding protein)